MHARRAEHDLPKARNGSWSRLALAKNDLTERLRRAGIPFFRPTDDGEQRHATGQVRKIWMPSFDRTARVGQAQREQLKELTAADPWFMERRVFGDVGFREDHEFAWTVEPIERRESLIDGEGQERRIPAIIPIALPDAEMRRLAVQLIGSAPIIEVEGRIETGTSAVATEGSFASFPGIVEEIDDRLRRFKIAVSIFGRATPVEWERPRFESV